MTKEEQFTKYLADCKLADNAEKIVKYYSDQAESYEKIAEIAEVTDHYLYNIALEKAHKCRRKAATYTVTYYKYCLKMAEFELEVENSK